MVIALGLATTGGYYKPLDFGIALILAATFVIAALVYATLGKVLFWVAVIVLFGICWAGVWVLNQIYDKKKP